MPDNTARAIFNTVPVPTVSTEVAWLQSMLGACAMQTQKEIVLNVD